MAGNMIERLGAATRLMNGFDVKGGPLVVLEVRAFIVRHIERAMGRIRPILGISLPSMSDVRRIVNTFAIARYVDVGDLREKHMDLLTGVLAHVLLAVRVDDDVMDPFYRHCLVDAAEYAALVAAFDEENFI